MVTRRSLLSKGTVVGTTGLLAGCVDTLESAGNDDETTDSEDQDVTKCEFGEQAIREYHDRNFSSVNFPTEAFDGDEYAEFDESLEHDREEYWPISGEIDSIQCGCQGSAEWMCSELNDAAVRGEFTAANELRFTVSDEEREHIIYAYLLEYEGQWYAWPETDWVSFETCRAEEHE